MRMQTEDRKNMILSAAIRVANGPKMLAGVTHGAVSKQCVILTSQRTVRRYFPQQRDLWLAVHASDKEAFEDQAIALGIIAAK